MDSVKPSTLSLRRAGWRNNRQESIKLTSSLVAGRLILTCSVPATCAQAGHKSQWFKFNLVKMKHRGSERRRRKQEKKRKTHSCPSSGPRPHLFGCRGQGWDKSRREWKEPLNGGGVFSIKTFDGKNPFVVGWWGWWGMGQPPRTAATYEQMHTRALVSPAQPLFGFKVPKQLVMLIVGSIAGECRLNRASQLTIGQSPRWGVGGGLWNWWRGEVVTLSKSSSPKNRRESSVWEQRGGAWSKGERLRGWDSSELQKASLREDAGSRRGASRRFQRRGRLVRVTGKASHEEKPKTGKIGGK